MPLVFEFPWLLAALAGLPALWWLLRVIPPPVRRRTFPAVRLLYDLRDSEDKPHRIPWWLLALRLLAAALLIVALAGPRFQPEPLLNGSDSLLLVIDNGWSAAPAWDKTKSEARTILLAARRKGRAVQLLTTARDTEEAASAVGLEVLSANQALSLLRGLEPRGYAADYDYVLSRLAAHGVSPDTDEVVFFSDGFGGELAAKLTRQLRAYGNFSVRYVAPQDTARLLLAPTIRAENFSVRIAELYDEAAFDRSPPILQLHGRDGALLAKIESKEIGHEDTIRWYEASTRLPRRLLDDTSLLSLNELSAGAVQLLADSDRRHRVLLWEQSATAVARHPLLSSEHYLTQAFSLFAEVQSGGLEQLSTFAPDLVVLDGDIILGLDETEALNTWLNAGGVLLRFAGEGLLREGRESRLLPVRLRPAVRALGGTLSWEEPVSIHPQPPETSPLAGIEVPRDLRIRRAVLAEPGPDLEERTWLWLQDGSPFITADIRAEGVLILVHSAANAEWSNLPISGYFVQMLRRLTELGRIATESTITESGGLAEPALLLDGFGRLRASSKSRFPIAEAIRLSDLEQIVPSAYHPAGFYGIETGRLSINLGGRIPLPEALVIPPGVSAAPLGATRSFDLRPLLYTLLLLLVLVEFWAGLWLRGLLTFRPFAPVASRLLGATRNRFAGKFVLSLVAMFFLVAVCFSYSPYPARAQSNQNSQNNLQSNFATAGDIASGANIQEPRMVYAITGVRETDEASFKGLRALNNIVIARTSVTLSEPFGVRVGVDDISPYPLLYWPYDKSASLPTAESSAALSEYLARGGMVLVDLRQAPFLDSLSETGSAFDAGSLAFLQALRAPALSQMREDYVLRRAFYLLEGTPGRYDSETFLLSAPDPAADNVSSFLLGTNDWAAAWALDSRGQPEYALIPGGEDQRELSYRFGVNLVLHALSGSYKADQIHLQAIIDRLNR